MRKSFLLVMVVLVVMSLSTPVFASLGDGEIFCDCKGQEFISTIRENDGLLQLNTGEIEKVLGYKVYTETNAWAPSMFETKGVSSLIGSQNGSQINEVKHALGFTAVLINICTDKTTIEFHMKDGSSVVVSGKFANLAKAKIHEEINGKVNPINVNSEKFLVLAKRLVDELVISMEVKGYSFEKFYGRVYTVPDYSLPAEKHNDAEGEIENNPYLVGYPDDTATDDVETDDKDKLSPIASSTNNDPFSGRKAGERVTAPATTIPATVSTTPVKEEVISLSYTKLLCLIGLSIVLFIFLVVIRKKIVAKKNSEMIGLLQASGRLLPAGSKNI